MVRALPILEVASEDTIFDQDMLLGLMSLVVDVDGASTLHDGRVVDDASPVECH